MSGDGLGCRLALVLEVRQPSWLYLVVLPVPFCSARESILSLDDEVDEDDDDEEADRLGATRRRIAERAARGDDGGELVGNGRKPGVALDVRITSVSVTG